MLSKTTITILLLGVFSPLYVYAVPGTTSVDLDGTLFVIGYDVEGLEILSIEADLNEIELILQVEVSSSPAILQMTFDREFFDATFEGEDDEFFVIADGDFVDIEEIETTSERRTLSFELPFGTEEIEIFGSELGGRTYGGVVKPEVMEEKPMDEEPIEEEMMEEPMKEETVEEKPPMVEEKPKTVSTKCGLGTILKDGVCVLEERCGPGTHLEDGICVLDEKSSGLPSIDRSMSSQFMVGAGSAFVIAFIIMTILWIISRGSRQKITA